MKIWGRTKEDNVIIKSITVTWPAKTAGDVEDWSEPFAKLCHEMDVSRPVILKKHVRDLEQFGSTAFRPADFLEPVNFDKFEVELF